MSIRRQITKLLLPMTALCLAASALTASHAQPLLAASARYFQSAWQVPQIDSSADQQTKSAMFIVCDERARDARGSTPIDVMQSRPELAAQDPAARTGAERARRLLPVARKLTAVALRQLARDYNVDLKRNRTIAARIQAVTSINPDIELRDNALVLVEEPRAIHFGTIFLAGLQSDEGMISVLAHELTHIGDGEDNDLYALFQQVSRRAVALTGLQLSDARAEELTCDLVGAMVARLFVAQSAEASTEPLVRRLARAVEHNCVAQDETDDEHLSPRETMRAVLTLDATLARGLTTGSLTHTQTLHHTDAQK